MKKLTGIVSEIPAVKTVNNVEVFIPRKATVDAYASMSSISYISNTTPNKEVKPSKIKSIVLCSVVAAALIGFATVGVIATLSNNPSVKDDIDYIKVSAVPGDTLWDLVKTKNPSYSGDIRYLVHVAKKHNGTSSLQAGQAVIIPVVEEVK